MNTSEHGQGDLRLCLKIFRNSQLLLHNQGSVCENPLEGSFIIVLFLAGKSKG